MSKLTEARKLFEEVAASDMTPQAVQGVIPPPASPDQSGDAQALDLLTDIRDLMGELVTAEKDELAAKQDDVPSADADEDEDALEDIDLEDIPEDDGMPEDGEDNEDGEDTEARNRDTKTTTSMPR